MAKEVERRGGGVEGGVITLRRSVTERADRGITAFI